jgi:hypothetical protein
LSAFRSARWKRSSIPGSSLRINSDCRSLRSSDFLLMPQPLRPPYQLNIDPETLNERPELAAQIGIIAALWSRVEMWLGILMGDLLGAEARYGLAMYYAIVSTSRSLLSFLWRLPQLCPFGRLHRDLFKSANFVARPVRRAAARRGLSDPFDDPFRQRPGMEIGLRAQRCRWMHPV